MRLWLIMAATNVAVHSVLFLVSTLLPYWLDVYTWRFFLPLTLILSTVNASMKIVGCVRHARASRRHSPELDADDAPCLRIRHRKGGETLLELEGSSLAGADLSGRDLRSASLRELDLRGTNLRDADLGDAYLGYADLRNAVLCGASLEEADLHGADLRGADLRTAKIDIGTNLVSAIFDRTTLWPEGFSTRWRGCIRATDASDAMPIPAASPQKDVDALPTPARGHDITTGDRPISCSSRTR